MLRYHLHGAKLRPFYRITLSSALPKTLRASPMINGFTTRMCTSDFAGEAAETRSGS